MDTTEGISSVEWFACPPPGDLPSPGIEPTSLMSPAFTGGFFITRPPRKPTYVYTHTDTYICLCIYKVT